MSQPTKLDVVIDAVTDAEMRAAYFADLIDIIDANRGNPVMLNATILVACRAVDFCYPNRTKLTKRGTKDYVQP